MGILSSIGTIAGFAIGGPAGASIGGTLGGLGDSAMAGSSAKGAAGTQAAGADAALKLQADIYNQNRQDMLPWLQTGTRGINRLDYLLGTAPIDADSVKQQLGFNKAGTPSDTRSRIPGSDSYNQYGAGTEYLVDGNWTQWEPGDSRNKLSADNQAAIDAEIARQKSDPEYGSLAKNFSTEDFQTDPGYDFRLSEGQKAIDRSAAAKGGLLSGAAVKAAARYGQDFASNEYQNAYNRYNTNQTNLYNRLAGISGAGQTASNNLATQGTNYANSAGQLMQNAANYNASGNVAQSNIFSTGLNSLTSGFGGSGGSTLPWQTAGNVNPAGGFY